MPNTSWARSRLVVPRESPAIQRTTSKSWRAGRYGVLLRRFGGKKVHHLGMMRRGGVAIWWVREMRWRILGENSSVSPTGMAHGVFGRSRRPRSPPVHWVSTGCAGQKNTPRRMKNQFGGHVWTGFLTLAPPNNVWRAFRGRGGGSENAISG
jgi:hypothetical protein